MLSKRDLHCEIRNLEGRIRKLECEHPLHRREIWPFQERCAYTDGYSEECQVCGKRWHGRDITHRRKALKRELIEKLQKEDEDD